MKYITVILSAPKSVDGEWEIFCEYNGETIKTASIVEFSEIVMEGEDTLDAINRAMARIKPSQWDSISFTYRNQ